MKTEDKRQLMAWLAQGNLSAAIAAGYTLSEAIAAGCTLSEAIAAGYTLSEARAAGYTLSEAIAAGYPLSAAIAAGYTLSEADIPVVAQPYTRMLADIQAGVRLHKQSAFGPNFDPATNLCKTPMCTAGHMVQMAGSAGYELQRKFGWELAAALLFEAAHPGWPQQNYGSIPQEWALAHIEVMAEREAAEASA
jgi:hypothetical protein